MIGLPQHITVAYIKETANQIFVEYVDPGRKNILFQNLPIIGLLHGAPTSVLVFMGSVPGWVKSKIMKIGNPYSQ